MASLNRRGVDSVEQICLADNVNGARFYDYQVGVGVVSSWMSKDPNTDASRIRGFSMRLRTGILWRRMRQISFFCHGSKLLLEIDGSIFDFCDPELVARFSNKFPFVRRFWLLRAGQLVLDLRYRFFALEEGAGDCDLLNYVVESTISPDMRRSTIDAWSR